MTDGHNQSVVVRLVDPGDLGWIVEAAFTGGGTYKWSLRRRSPTPQMLETLLWSEVPLAAVIEVDERPALLLQLSRVDSISGVAYLDVLLGPARPERISQIRPALSDFIDRGVQDFGLRLVYVEALESVWDLLEQIAGVQIPIEARLREHERVGQGSFVDLLVGVVRRVDAPARLA